MGPVVVSAVKSGTMSPKSSVIVKILLLHLIDPYLQLAAQFSDKVTELANNLYLK